MHTGQVTAWQIRAGMRIRGRFNGDPQKSDVNVVAVRPLERLVIVEAANLGKLLAFPGERYDELRSG